MSDSCWLKMHPEFAELPRKDGKRIGTDAAIFLSACLRPAAFDADDEGWFRFPSSECYQRTGLVFRQHEHIREVLADAGYLVLERSGHKGELRLRLVGNYSAYPVSQNGETRIPVSQNGETDLRSVSQNGETRIGVLFHKTVKPVSQKRETSRAGNNQCIENPIQKGRETPANIALGFGTLAENPPTIEEVVRMVILCGGTEESGQKCWAHFSQFDPPWTDPSGRKMSDLKAVCMKWVLEDKRRARLDAARNGNGHAPETSSLIDSIERPQRSSRFDPTR